MKPPALAPDLIAFADHLARCAREQVHETASRLAHDIKDDGSPVTAIDRAVEAALRREINQRLPDHGIIGEEYGAEHADRDWVWILDPIDGTRQFVAGLPNFGTLIALCYRDQPVIGVIAHPWYEMTCIGVEGEATRINAQTVTTSEEVSLDKIIACLSDPDAMDETTRPGYQALQAASLWNVYDGGCLGHAALARGQIGVALNGPNLEPFDIAALIPVVKAAGGSITDWQGRALDARSSGAIVASANARLHETVLALLA